MKFMLRHVKGWANRLIRSVFFSGVSFVFLGCIFLLAAFMEAPRAPVVLAAAFIIIGSFFAFLAVRMGRRSIWLFLATFFILVGFFLLLSSLRILPVTPLEWWPAVSIFAGLSLIPSGWHHFGAVRRSYLVPAILFIILGAVLLVFSLNIVNFSFRQFLIRWWHLLLVLAGILLTLIALGTKFLPDTANPPDTAGSPEDSGHEE
jgi:hypothetical protein